MTAAMPNPYEVSAADYWTRGWVGVLPIPGKSPPPGVVIHKRHGVGDPSQQWVTLTLTDFAALLAGVRPDTHPRGVA